MSGLLEITSSWASGASAADLKPQVAALLKTLDAEALVEVFKVLPRPLAMPHFAAFRKAEEATKSADVSTLLVSTGFENCGPVEGLGETIAYAVGCVPDDVLAPHAAAVFQWRVRLCEMRPKGIDLNAPAHAAMVYALNAPAYLTFEQIFDSVDGIALASEPAKRLRSYIETVLLGGAGTAGHQDFVKAAPKDTFAGVQVDTLLRKAQMLSLCRLLSGKSQMSMKDVQAGLQVDSAETAEGLVVDATLANIIDVDLDRSAGVVAIKSVMPLRFDTAAMKALVAAIDDNIKFVDRLILDYNATA